MSVCDHADAIPGLSPDIEDLSLFFAKRITSKHNQHAIVMIVGPTGTGKSWGAVALCRGVAEKVAEIVNKGIASDYFNFEKTFATITKDEVKRVMDKPEQYNIILLDDVAARALNARNYKDEDNIDLNAVLTTFRPNHNLVVMTMVAGFMLDKVPRNLSHYIIEMEQAYFDEGFTIAKVKEIVYHHSTQKTHFPYLQAGAQKYVRHIFTAPPRNLMIEYEKMRAIQLDRASQKQQEVKKEDKSITAFKLLTPSVLSWHEEGLSQSKISDKVGISQAWVNKILTSNGIEGPNYNHKR